MVFFGDLFLNFHYNIGNVIKLKKKCFLKIFPKLFNFFNHSAANRYVKLNILAKVTQCLVKLTHTCKNTKIVIYFS